MNAPLHTEEPTHPASKQFRWSGRTDRGKVRRNNEDSFLCLEFDAREVRYLGKFGEASTDRTDLVFAVSDGMGGAMAGEFASQITVDKITRLLPRSYRQAAGGMDAGIGDVLEELFDQIHRALMFLGTSYEECAGMGATLSLCWFTPGWMYFGHIGDSRLYYLSAREKGIRQLSQDHSHVGWLYRQGKLTEREARNHPRRNVLQNALGAGHQFVTPQIGAVAYEPGDIFLLGTDGLTEGLFDAQLLSHVRSPDPDSNSASGERTAADRLVEASLEQAGKDNTTALLVEVV